VVRVLERLGYRLQRHGARQDIYDREDAQRPVSVPRHSGDLPTGTVRSISRQAGISPNEAEQVGPQQTSPLALRAVPGEPRIYLNVVVNLQLMINEPGEGFVQVVFDRAERVPRVYFTVRPIPGVGSPHGVA